MMNLGLMRLMYASAGLIGTAVLGVILALLIAYNQTSSTWSEQRAGMARIDDVFREQEGFLSDYGQFLDAYGEALNGFRGEAFSLVVLTLDLSEASLAITDQARQSVTAQSSPEQLVAHLLEMERALQLQITPLVDAGLTDDQTQSDLQRAARRIQKAIENIGKAITRYDVTDHRLSARIDRLDDLLIRRVLLIQQAVLPHARARAARIAQSAKAIRAQADNVLKESASLGSASRTVLQAQGQVSARQQRALEEVGVILAAAIALVIAVTLINALVTKSVVIRRVQQLEGAMETIASGECDLGARLDSFGEDELGRLAGAFNRIIGNLDAMVAGLRAEVAQVKTLAGEVACISQEIYGDAELERQRVCQVRQSTDDLQRFANSVEELSNHAHLLAAQVTDRSAQGRGVVQTCVAEMLEIVNRVSGTRDTIGRVHQASNTIGTLTSSIHDIADQTNMLALNAAIESARAGEQGRGFSVVADEVRNLSSRTTGATQEVERITDQLNSRVSSAVDFMVSVQAQVRCGEQSLRKLAAEIAGMADDSIQANEANLRIISATGEQYLKMKALRDNLEALFATLAHSSAKADATRAVAVRLTQTAEQIEQTIQGFQRGDCTPHGPGLRS